MERKVDAMGYNENDDWMEFRGDCLEYIRNLHENALKKYLNEIGFKDIFAYDYNYSENKFTIYTCRPGIWIGKGGEGVRLLKEILSNEVKENCDVSFKEIHGHFIAHQ